MKGKIVHIEIPSGDTAQAKEFWGKLTGWSFKNYAEGHEGAPEYHMFEGEPGGAIYPSEDKGIRVYFEADDIDAELDKIRELGGETEDKMPVPSMGWFAHAKDPDGQRVLRLADRRVGPDARGHGRSVGFLALEQPRRIEQLELWRRRAEDRLRDELAAGEAQHVAVARVAGGDPDAVPARDPADEREAVLRSRRRCPASGARSRGCSPSELGGERLELRPGSARVIVSSSVNSVSRLVSRLPPRTSRRSGCLLPVIEAVARVVRARIERLARAARSRSPGPRTGRIARRAPAAGRSGSRRSRSRPARPRARPSDSTRVLLDDLGAGLGRTRREPPHPAGRLKRPVARVQDRAAERGVERRAELVDPLGGEAVLAQRLVLGAERRPAPRRRRSRRLPTRRNASPASSSMPVEGALGEAPERLRRSRAEPLPRAVVRHRAAAQREAAVPPARARGDRARLVQAHAQPALGQRERTRAAGHAAADDDDVGAARRRAARASGSAGSASQYESAIWSRC